MTASVRDRYALGPLVEAGVVFVHVPKTGGTSVARALYGTDGGGHRTLADYRRELGADWVRQAYTFAVVRDPVDRLASAARYLRAGGQNALDAAFGRDVLSAYDSVDDFVCGWLTPETARTQVHFRPQIDFVCDGAGGIGVDDLIRFERLAEGWEAVRARTGQGRPLPHLNAGPDRPPPRLSAEARARIRAVYADDFRLFSYPCP